MMWKNTRETKVALFENGRYFFGVINDKITYTDDIFYAKSLPMLNTKDKKFLKGLEYRKVKVKYTAEYCIDEENNDS